MTVDRQPPTPLRRSRRGQPLLQVADSARDVSNDRVGLQTHDPICTRPTRVEDLSDSQIAKMQDGELDIEDFETRFYDRFEKSEVTKTPLRVYGKGKRPARTTAVSETYGIGETVFVDTSRQSSIAVITAIWTVVGGDEEEYMNVALHWFLKPNQLASIRARREHLEVCYILFDASNISLFSLERDILLSRRQCHRSSIDDLRSLFGLRRSRVANPRRVLLLRCNRPKTWIILRISMGATAG